MISNQEEIGEAQKTVEELTQQLSANATELETERQEKAAAAGGNALEELAGVKGERDTKVQEIGEAQKTVEELTQQLSARVAELRQNEKREPLEPSVSALEAGLLELKVSVMPGQEIRGTQKTVEKLTQQLSANAAELETERQEKAAAASGLTL